VPSRYPVVNGARLIAALQRAGWTVVRRRGSHVRLKRGAGSISVPAHGGRAVPIGTLAAILSDADMSPETLRRLL
jgi:predicted RNA binding protein YcfA (HicA-like mRNA interferase family)